MPPRWRIQNLDQTTSTNDDARRAAEVGETEGYVVTAKQQSAGRGRQGRIWESQTGNLFCSILLQPKDMPAAAGFYSFVAALAVRDVVFELLHPQEQQNSLPLTGRVREGGERLGADSILGETAKRHPPLPNPPRKGEGTPSLSSHNITLKWPNDVLVGGKKISGILLEVSGDKLIVGIGLNVAHYPENALYPATSLRTEISAIGSSLPPAGRVREGGVPLGTALQNSETTQSFAPLPNPPREGEGTIALNLETLLEKLLERIFHWHDIMQKENFAPIRAAWLTHAQQGPLTVRTPQETLQGHFAGLTENGHLRLLLEGGTERSISTGDVFAN